MTLARVLVVEDDRQLSVLLARGLRARDFHVETVPDGPTALAVLDRPGAAVDAVILDVGLPGPDGLEVCQAIRATGRDVPVLFLTARGRLPDVLAGFAAGGDDHVTKPFALSEVVVRLEALLRRRPPEAPAAGGSSTETGVRLDPSQHALRGPGGARPVTPTEYRLVAALLAASGSVVSRRSLVATGWPGGGLVHDNTLDQYLSRLRRKLFDASAGTVTVTTVHGVGYRLDVAG